MLFDLTKNYPQPFYHLNSTTKNSTMESKKTIKVSFQDETKRIKITHSFEDLVAQVTKSFEALPDNFKFYYLDEDFEIISVTSDDDLKEVFDSDIQSMTKLVIAENQSDARQVLTLQMEEPNSARLKTSMFDLNQDKHMPLRPSKTLTDKLGLDFEKISHQNLAESFEQEPLLDKKIQEDTPGLLTERLSDVKLIDTGNLANEIQNQAQDKSQDKSQDKFVSIIHQPEDKDCLNDEISTVEQIREEIKLFWRQNMRDLFMEHLQTKQEVQKQVVHEQHACNGCGMCPIVGIRYKCSV